MKSENVFESIRINFAATLIIAIHQDAKLFQNSWVFFDFANAVL